MDLQSFNDSPCTSFDVGDFDNSIDDFNENQSNPIMDFPNDFQTTGGIVDEIYLLNEEEIAQEEEIDFNKFVPEQLKDDLCFQNYVQNYRYMSVDMFKKTLSLILTGDEKKIISKELLVCYERLILMKNTIPLISNNERRVWQRNKNYFYIYYSSYAPIIFYWIKNLMENGIINFRLDKKRVCIARINDKKRTSAGVKYRGLKLISIGNQSENQNNDFEMATLHHAMINYFENKLI